MSSVSSGTDEKSAEPSPAHPANGSPGAHPPGVFPTTQWSEVARAGDKDPAVRRAALGQLIERYAPAFLAHAIRRRGLKSHDADDVLQGFVCDQVVAGELISKVDRTRGRLRNFLLASFDHYLLTLWRRERAQKRAPGSAILRLDAPVSTSSDADVPTLDAPAPQASADIFDLQWARQVLDESIARMREECRRGPQPGHDRIWRLFDARVLRPLIDGGESPGYTELVRDIGFESPAQASNALVTGKRMMSRVLRGVIAEYAADPGEVEAEMDDLWNILCSARGGGAGTTH